MVRAAAAEYGGVEAAAAALFERLGGDEAARIAALAASDDPLDDGTRRYTPEEIEALMATRQKRLPPEDVKRLHEYVAAARQADPSAKARGVYERAKADLGIEVSFTNFQITYWYAYRRAKKLPKKAPVPPRPAPAAAPPRPPAREKPAAQPAAPPPTRRKQAASRTRRRSYTAAIEMLRKELNAVTERADRLREAIEALELIEARNGGAR